MPYDAERIHGALKRLLANGLLAHLPGKEEDLDILLALATARFTGGTRYREVEVNDVLRRWLETFCSPGGVDHVTVRRCLVDARYLRRDRAGSTYEMQQEKLGAVLADDARHIEPASVVAETRREREARKRSRPA